MFYIYSRVLIKVALGGELHAYAQESLARGLRLLDTQIITYHGGH